MNEDLTFGVLVLDFENPEDARGFVYDLVYSVLDDCKNSCLDGSDFVGTVLKEVTRGLFRVVDSEVKVKELLYVVIDAFRDLGFDDEYLLKAGFLGGLKRVDELLSYNFYQFLLSETYDSPPSEMVFDELNRGEFHEAEEISDAIERRITEILSLMKDEELVETSDKNPNMFPMWLENIKRASFNLVERMQSPKGLEIEIEAYFSRIISGGDYEKLRRKFVDRFKTLILSKKDQLLAAYKCQSSEIGQNGTDEEICEEIFDKLYEKRSIHRPN